MEDILKCYSRKSTGVNKGIYFGRITFNCFTFRAMVL